MGYRDRIRDEAQRRGICYLVHFTQAWNLPGIVTHGLLSRAELIARDLDAYASAGRRLDERDETVSVSISAMNGEMYKTKVRNGGRTAWIVLLLDPAILWSLECRFCRLNAGTNEMKCGGRMGSPWHFSQMFSDDLRPPRYQGSSYRAETGIPLFLTTLPEAEVQVLERIPPEAIVHACVERGVLDEAVNEELKRLLGKERDVSAMQGIPTFRNGYSEWGCPGPDLALTLTGDQVVPRELKPT